MISFPEGIVEIEMTCALRFDGWAYLERIGDSERFPRLTENFLKTWELFPNDLDNFATFFAFQRFLHKWGGEYLTKYSPEHKAYDFLFLALYRFPVQEPFVSQAFESRWNSYGWQKIESAAAYVRKSFRRRGRGPQTFL